MGLQHDLDWQDHERRIEDLESETDEMDLKFSAIDNFLTELSTLINDLRKSL